MNTTARPKPIIACMPNSYGRLGTRAAIENIGAAGLECLELAIRTHGVDSPFDAEPLLTDASTSADVQNVKHLLEQHGIQPVSCNVTSGNPLDPAVVETTKRKLDLAAQFGVALVVGGAGEAPEPDDKTRLYQQLTDIGDHAGNLGITYCFETHPGLCRDHRRMLETMDALDHPHLKLNFDTANILYYNQFVDGEVALAKVCHHVKHIHLKDSEGEFGRWCFPAIGRGGAVNFVRVLEIMRPLGFRGPYSIEVEGIAGEGELALEDYQARIVESVKHLRNCGYFD